MSKGKKESNSLRSSYLISFVVLTIIIQLVMMSDTFLEDKEQSIERLDNVRMVESTKVPSNLPIQRIGKYDEIEIDFRMVTLIGILMVAIGYLLSIKRKPNDKKGEENISIKLEGVMKGENENRY